MNNYSRFGLRMFSGETRYPLSFGNGIISALATAILSFLFTSQPLGAASRDAVYEVTAVTSTVSPCITLNWTNKSTYVTPIHRRVKGATAWESTVTVSAGIFSYADTTALPGVAYEYSLWPDSYTYTGGIVAGCNIPLVESRGKVILLIDQTMTTPLASEIAQLQKNLVADGWTVIRHDVPRETVSPGTTSNPVWLARIAEQQNIRSIVQADYNTSPDDKWALFILGRIPQPYSGIINPDGHGEHYGAWPTDLYYVTDGSAFPGDPNGGWTDTSVNTGTSGLADVRNYNLPGDGKFDNYLIPADVKIQTGRVDLSNMARVPTGMTETELLRQYLVRDNNFRRVQGSYANVARRGIVDDNFNSYAQTAWCSGFGFFGSNAGQMDAADWFTTLSTTPMLFAYGCGGGYWTSASGVGDSIIDFGKTDSKAVFTQLFGSYFGDWDCADNFMRAPLAGTVNSLGLTCQWSGRGEIPLYHMALGDPIGYCTRKAQNSYSASTGDWYQGGYYRWIHQCLMGDPTLRLHSIAPPTRLTATSATGGITINWQASPDTTLSGYHLYRSTSAAGPFTRITGTVADGTNPTGSCLSTSTLTYTDTSASLVAGTAYTYLVKAVRIETSPSGSYANQSIGEYVTVTHRASAPVPIAPTRLTVNRTATTTCVLNWDDNATNETGYLIERCDPATGIWSQINSVAANVTTYTDTSATAGQIFYYRVRATNANGNTDYSNTGADYNLPGTVYDQWSRYYVFNKDCGICSLGLTRFNGTAGDVSLTYATTGLLGTAGVDYTATTSTVTWAHGTSGVKSINIPVPNPAGQQLTKLFALSYGNPTNGLALATPMTPYIFICDTTSQTLPSPWATTTFGSVSGAGYAEQVNGTFGVAVQSADTYDANDSGRFLYRAVTGDFTFSARVTYNSYQTTWSGGFCALAVRGDTSSSPVMYMFGIYDTNIFQVVRSASSTISSGVSWLSGFGSAAKWMRIVRTGYNVNYYYSSDAGTTWSQATWLPTGTAGSTLTNLPSTAYVGFYLTSGRGAYGPMDYAQFDNVTLTTSNNYKAVGNIATLTAAAGINLGDVSLNWSAASDALIYQVERSTLSNSGFAKVATVAAPTVTFTDTGLTVNTTYYYRVMGSNPAYNSAYSAVASTQPYLPPGIAGWRYVNFGSTGAVSGYSGDLDSPSGDGITNLAKYALGLTASDSYQNPVYTKITNLPTFQTQTVGSAQYLTCTFTHNKAATDVTLTVEATDDLKGAWTPINPLLAANQVSVTDSTPTAGVETIVVKDTQPISVATKRFMRFKITHESNIDIGAAQGYVTTTVAAGTGTSYALTAMSLPMHRPFQGQGQLTGCIEYIFGNTITNYDTASNGYWLSGSFAKAASPYAIKITNGSAAGRLFRITANSSNRVTVDTQGSDLSDLGITIWEDTYEIFPVHTILSVFGTPATTGVKDAAVYTQADLVMILNNGVWIKYYYNTAAACWKQVGPDANANNTPILPDTLVVYNRLTKTPLTFTTSGRVPATQRMTSIANGGLAPLANGWPISLTLATSGIQSLPGWVASTNSNNADIVQILVSGAWRKYYHDGAIWREVGSKVASDNLAIPAGSGMVISRKSTDSGNTLLTQPVPYPLP